MIDFNAAVPGDFIYTPYYEDGFRVSSLPTAWAGHPGQFLQGHYDVLCGTSGDPIGPNCGAPGGLLPNYDGTNWLGTDWTSCAWWIPTATVPEPSMLALLALALGGLAVSGRATRASDRARRKEPSNTGERLA